MKKILILIGVICLSLVGCSNNEGKVELNGYFNSGLSPIGVNEKWGYIDKSGKFAIKPKFDKSSNFSEGLASVSLNSKAGFIDTSGEFVIEDKYDEARSFSEGLASVSFDNKFGFIDKKGNMIVDYRYEDTKEFKEGVAGVKSDGKWGFIDKKGNLIVEHKFDDIDHFDNSVASVKVSEGWGIIDKTGHFVMNPGLDEHIIMSEGIGAMKMQFDNYGFINFNMDVEMSGKYVNATYCSEDMIGVRSEGKWGFLRKSGRMGIEPEFALYSLTPVIEPKYKEIGIFSEGLASVMIDDKWGFIDKKGKVVIEPQFDSLGIFKDGMANMKKNGETVFIDKTGEIKIKLSDYYKKYKIRYNLNKDDTSEEKQIQNNESEEKQIENVKSKDEENNKVKDKDINVGWIEESGVWKYYNEDGTEINNYDLALKKVELVTEESYSKITMITKEDLENADVAQPYIDDYYFFQVVDNEGAGSQILTLINKLDFYTFGLNVDGTTYTIEERLEPNF
jgi:hypothetical protein